MSEFLKFAYEKGKIRPLSDAFKKYPPEEEIHKGNPEYFLKEEEVVYKEYNIGDIVYVKEYLYNDGTPGKNHLFVLIDEEIGIPIEYFGMLISSRIVKKKYDTNIELKKDNLNNLKVDSIVKTDEIYKIDKQHILFKIGIVENDKILEYKDKYVKLYTEE